MYILCLVGFALLILLISILFLAIIPALSEGYWKTSISLILIISILIPYVVFLKNLENWYEVEYDYRKQEYIKGNKNPKSVTFPEIEFRLNETKNYLIHTHILNIKLPKITVGE